MAAGPVRPDVSGRIAFGTRNGNLEVIVGPRRHWRSGTFLLVGGGTVLLVLAVGVTVFADVLRGRLPGGPFIFLWLIFWFGAFLFFTYVWVWTDWGREIVTPAADLLTVRRELFGLGRTDTFLTADIRNLRAAGFFGDPWAWTGQLHFLGLAGGNVAFDSAGSVHRFGILLSEDEARQIVEKLTPYLRALKARA